MTPALREIFRLWLRQKRHDFHWQQIFLAVYFGGLYLFLLFALYFAMSDELKEHPIPVEFIAFLPAVAVGIQIGDLMMKLFWRRSPVEMDDYLRTRPVAPSDWARFILFDTSMGFLQWLFALMLGVSAVFFLPWWSALVILVLAFTVSLTNALFQNCWRRAPGNPQTLPLVFGYLVWTAVLWGIAVSDAALSYIYPESLTLFSILFLLAFLAVNLLTLAILHRYFMRMKNHNEETHAPVSSPVHSLGQVSLWSIEWVQLLRSKRLRTSFFFIAVIFLLNTYLQQNPNTVETFHGLNLMLLFGIGFPSIILAQWVLGIEANFFAGIWTKPWPVEGILRRKYVFFCAICGVMAVLILPCVFWMGMSPWMWFCSLLFACGVFVLPFMATCLFSSRMDLFSSAFFNYQGGNKQLNFFSFIMFIPMGIYFAAYFLLPHLYANLLIGGLGLLGLALHRPYILWISRIWHRRRYKIMERWQTE